MAITELMSFSTVVASFQLEKPVEIYNKKLPNFSNLAKQMVLIATCKYIVVLKK